MNSTMVAFAGSVAGSVAVAGSVVKRGRKPKQNKQKLDNTKIKTYHFNMVPETVAAIDYFATMHRHDDRKTFKEAWEKWIELEDIAAIIQRETERLVANGYRGDVLQKLFHSARYYYRKKPAGDNNVGVGCEEEETIKKRKKYETVGSEILEKMDQHILQIVKENIVDVLRMGDKTVLYSDISPARAFELFRETVEIDEGLLAKYKKTYKNRFFLSRGTYGSPYDPLPCK